MALISTQTQNGPSETDNLIAPTWPVEKGFEGFVSNGAVAVAPDGDEISVSILRDTGATLFLLD